MYEKDIPESCFCTYFLTTSRWCLASVIYQIHAIDLICHIYGSQTQYVVIILQSVSAILTCLTLMSWKNSSNCDKTDLRQYKYKGTKNFSHKWVQLQIRVWRISNFILFNRNNCCISDFCITGMAISPLFYSKEDTLDILNTCFI